MMVGALSKFDKLYKRLCTFPKDFSWEELKKLLYSIGYKEKKSGKTSGSRVKFVNDKTGDIISLHKPHPSNVLKHYQVKQIVEKLKGMGFKKV